MVERKMLITTQTCCTVRRSLKYQESEAAEQGGSRKGKRDFDSTDINMKGKKTSGRRKTRMAFLAWEFPASDHSLTYIRLPEHALDAIIPV